MALKVYPSDPAMDKAFAILNYIFAVVFNLE